MSINLYDLYATDKSREEEGAWVEIAPGAEFKIARSNSQRSASSLRNARRPHKTLLRSYEQRDSEIPEDVQDKINMEWVVNGLLLDWRGPNITDRSGNVKPYSKEAASQLLSDLPDLMIEVIRHSTNLANYRESVDKEAEKN